MSRLTRPPSPPTDSTFWPTLQIVFRLLVTIGIYLTVGCVFYTLVEEKLCESEDTCNPSTGLQPWTLIDALYFSMVTMSTVGFGDMAPTKDVSKVFTCFYILVGMTGVFVEVTFALSGAVNFCENIVVNGVRRVWRRVCPCRYTSKIGTELDGERLEPDGTPDFPCRYTSKIGMELDGERLEPDGTPDFVKPPSAITFWAENLSFPLTVFILFQFLSAAVFTRCQDDLLYWDAFYLCLVTASTVGYGDVSLTTDTSKTWMFFHIALSVSWLAALISEVGERKLIRKAQLQEVQMLGRQLDKELIQSLDRDGTGVDMLEYVVGMLIELNVEICGQPLTWDHVQPFIQRFKAADLDNSGRLGKEDLALMVDRRRQELGEKNARKIESHQRYLDATSPRSQRPKPAITRQNSTVTHSSKSASRESSVASFSGCDNPRTPRGM